jgi:hypothetical protein
MSDYILPIVVVAALAVWWLSSHSLAGSVARTPETEAALADAAQRVAQTLKTFGPGPYEVTPVWAHGCPCVRVSVPDAATSESSESTLQARKAAARTLENAVRANPAFAHIASKYSGEQGLHWY